MPNCSQEDCDRSFDKNHMPDASAVQLGWGCHNNKWLCPVHMAEHDAPAIVEAERKAKEKAELQAREAKEHEALMEQWRQASAEAEARGETNEPRPADTQDTEPAPAPADRDGEV